MRDIAGKKGGSGVWQRIISEMPTHDVYIEPFWGRGTIARKKRPSAVTVAIDLDCEAITHARSFSDLQFRADGVQWLKEYFGLRPIAFDSGGHTAEYSAAQLGGEDVEAETSGAARYRSNAATFGGFHWSHHFCYIDPPYLGCCGYYRHELDESQHRDLCRVFTALPCPAMLSGYDSEAYADELCGTRAIRIPTVNRAGRRCTEVVWMNYSPPSQYHDVRFVGRDRRQRERISRRVRNWSASLANMPPAEQQAVFEAVQAARDRTTR